MYDFSNTTKNTKNMLPILALVLAIPTYGLSLVAYIGWVAYKKKSSLSNTQNLNKVERAILLVAREHNGSVLGTSVEGVTYSEVMSVFTNKMLFEKESYRNIGKSVEVQLTLTGSKFDVHLSREPNGGKEAILRVRRSERWLDELYTWLVPNEGFSHNTSKYFLPHKESIIMGSATMPEWRPKEPTHVPANIGYLTHLETLGLINQHLVSLPESLRNLRNLKELKLGGNSLTCFPRQVFDMPNLEVLTLWFNDIEELPSDIGELVTLRGLDLSHNKFKSLPDSITNLIRLKKFYMFYDGEVELTRAQKIWLVELIRAGAEVSLNKEVDERLLEEFPELAHIPRVREEFDLPQ